MTREFGYKVTTVEKNEIMIQKAKIDGCLKGLDIQLIEENVEQLPCLNNSI